MATRKPTIQVLFPHGRAPDARAHLFGGLEAFANLGASEEEFRRFAAQWPTFAPVEIRKGKRSDEPRGEPLGLTPEMHGIVLKYQGYLRRAWSSDPETDRQGLVDLLLGLQMDLANPDPESSTEVGKKELRSSLEKLMGEPYLGDPAQFATLPAEGPEPYPQSSTEVKTAERKTLKLMLNSLTMADSDQYAVYPKVIVASWELGEFSYFPLTDFQRAFYLLFREKWRARICSQCERYFIADKPRQRYCSTACHGMAKRTHGLRWWKTKGDARRRERMRKPRRRKALKGKK